MIKSYKLGEKILPSQATCQEYWQRVLSSDEKYGGLGGRTET